MPLGFANFRHDTTLSSRDKQSTSFAVTPQREPSSAASITSQHPLIQGKKVNNAPKKNAFREMMDAVKPKQ